MPLLLYSLGELCRIYLDNNDEPVLVMGNPFACEELGIQDNCYALASRIIGLPESGSDTAMSVPFWQGKLTMLTDLGGSNSDRIRKLYEKLC